ncbi:hypothetical protein MNBD_IGNAVI01-18 [hydrothermal vent metagenome]|uniref:Uncharacterized protein n=1 Tax=hydrothermal vent metagenome TaxID=652676 RepID=A0A3B1CSF0_9ZZZZ
MTQSIPLSSKNTENSKETTKDIVKEIANLITDLEKH